MKKLFFMAALLCAGFALTSCNDDDDNNLAPQETTYTVDFEGSNFTSLIDTVQYGGPLLYSMKEYKWTDANTTLSGEVVKADWSSWYGMPAGSYAGWDHGFAISNYVDTAACNYQKQLAVPESNGSKNFAVCYADKSLISFADGKAHTVQSMDYSPTKYLLDNELTNADKNYYFKAVVTFTHADSTTTTKDIQLAKGTDVQKTWKTISLTDVKPFVSASFSFAGSDSGEWGLNTPKYIAIDNIVVKK